MHAPINIFNDFALRSFVRLYSNVKTGARSYRTAVMILYSLLGKKSAHVLLADDDAEDRELFQELMHEIMPNVKISMAVNGKNLIDMLNDGTAPDIIFLDLNMPLKNGHECLNEIRNNTAWSAIPVIIYSTSRNPNDIEATFKSGANFYFPKPDSFRDFKTIMKRLLDFDVTEFVQQTQRERFVLDTNRKW